MQRSLQHSLNTIIMTSPSPTVQISNIRKSSRQRRPVIPEIGYVQPTLAEWAHLVVEPSDSSRGSIFLGPQQAAGKNKLVPLKEASPPITAIVNCTNVFPNHHESEFITYCRIAVNDEAGANILVYLEGAVKFIRHQILIGSSVLVQCQMGVSRSSTVVIAAKQQIILKLGNSSQHRQWHGWPIWPKQWWPRLWRFERRCPWQCRPVQMQKARRRGQDSNKWKIRRF